MEEATSYKDLIPAFHFEVSFIEDGQKRSDAETVPFSEVSGIGIELQTEDIMEGGDNNHVIRLPKPPKAQNLVLKKALLTSQSSLVKWARKAVEEFDIETRTIVVSILDYQGTALKSWDFEGAYPVKLSIGELSASKNELVIETLELAYRNFHLT